MQQSQTMNITIKLILKFGGGNQEFERHLFLMNQPPLESTLIGKNTTNAKTSKLDSTPVGT